MDAAAGWYKRAVAAGEEADAKAKADAGGGEGGAAAAPAAEEMGLAAQALVMEGNNLYEWSQLLAAVGKEWRPVLDAAVERFKSAKCSDADVRGALKNHTNAGELELGPDPEEEAAAAAAAAAAKAKEKEGAKAKGLPSLAPKKKGGA
jgi:hypothetical protein